MVLAATAARLAAAVGRSCRRTAGRRVGHGALGARWGRAARRVIVENVGASRDLACANTPQAARTAPAAVPQPRPVTYDGPDGHLVVQKSHKP